MIATSYLSFGNVPEWKGVEITHGDACSRLNTLSASTSAADKMQQLRSSHIRSGNRLLARIRPLRRVPLSAEAVPDFVRQRTPEHPVPKRRSCIAAGHSRAWPMSAHETSSEVEAGYGTMEGSGVPSRKSMEPSVSVGSAWVAVVHERDAKRDGIGARRVGLVCHHSYVNAMLRPDGFSLSGRGGSPAAGSFTPSNLTSILSRGVADATRQQREPKGTRFAHTRRTPTATDLVAADDPGMVSACRRDRPTHRTE